MLLFLLQAVSTEKKYNGGTILRQLRVVRGSAISATKIKQSNEKYVSDSFCTASSNLWKKELPSQKNSISHEWIYCFEKEIRRSRDRMHKTDGGMGWAGS